MDFALILLTPVALIGFGLLMARRARLDWQRDVGWRKPAMPAALGWILAFVLLAIALEYIAAATGGEDMGGAWIGKYDGSALALRIVAVGLLYPLAEEFFFRGTLFGLTRRKFGTLAAVAFTSLFFAVLHLQYEWTGMAFVLVDALFYAAARIRTGSVFVPMACHLLGNGYAVFERLTP